MNASHTQQTHERVATSCTRDKPTGIGSALARKAILILTIALSGWLSGCFESANPGGPSIAQDRVMLRMHASTARVYAR